MKRALSSLLAAAALIAVSSSAQASVWLQNKDGHEVTVNVHRSNNHMDVSISRKSKMELPDAPMSVTLKKQTIDAKDGDTVVIENGKLTRVPGDEDEDSGSGDSGSTGDTSATPAATETAAATPAPTDAPKDK